ncbi:transcription factor WhiB [Naumannella sp. ID2617S]|nr:transcription factor WhiB [Naumannella sp. ID2617S]
MASTMIETATQGCLENADLYQHPLLEEPPSASAPADQRRQHMMMTRKAENLCVECPIMTQCLYNAVVKYDVSGFVAGTTARQRSEIRARLGITVTPEDFDTLAGVTARHRQVDHDEVVRLRNANPHESLETLAHRLGCSLSTVKRHLRRHRNEAAQQAPAEKKRVPTMAEVMTAYREVTRGIPAARRVA